MSPSYLQKETLKETRMKFTITSYNAPTLHPPQKNSRGINNFLNFIQYIYNIREISSVVVPSLIFAKRLNREKKKNRETQTLKKKIKKNIYCF